MFLFLSSWERFNQCFLQVADQEGAKPLGVMPIPRKMGQDTDGQRRRPRGTFHVP